MPAEPKCSSAASREFGVVLRKLTLHDDVKVAKQR
jgi:hypothetical protein